MLDFGNDENIFYRSKDLAFRSNKLIKKCTVEDEIVINSWKHHFSPECVVENQNVDLFIGQVGLNIKLDCVCTVKNGDGD